MVIRPYVSSDCPTLAQIYYDTIHTVCAADYTPAQLDAWASGNVDLQVYCSQISSLISSLIIYLCAFVAFFKYMIQVYLRKRSEKQTLATKEGGEEK
jgi:hypothetical protein